MLVKVMNTSWENLQIAMHKSVRRLFRSRNLFVPCNLKISGGVYNLEQPHTQYRFQFPIVFGMLSYLLGMSYDVADFVSFFYVFQVLLKEIQFCPSLWFRADFQFELCSFSSLFSFFLKSLIAKERCETQ